MLHEKLVLKVTAKGQGQGQVTKIRSLLQFTTAHIRTELHQFRK